MPRVTGRRHPVFLRLQKAVAQPFPDRVTLVVPNSNDDGEPGGLVYVVTLPCKKLNTWVRQIRALHKDDETHQTDERISQLSLKPVTTQMLAQIGKVDSEMFGQQDAVQTARSARMLYWSTTWIAILVDRLDGMAVGFVSFAVNWDVPASSFDDELEIEVQPDQVWIAPEFRGRRWSDSLAYAVSSTARMHIAQVDASCRWGCGGSAPVKVTMGAEIYSSSGRAFLWQCYEHLRIELSLRYKPAGLEVVELELDARL